MQHSPSTIHLVDRESPVLYVPKAIVQEAVSISENTVTLGDANVTDNSLAAYVSNDAPEYFALGNTTVTCTATDDSENTVSEVQNVLIVDTVAPQFEPINVIVSEAIKADANKINLTFKPIVTDVQNLSGQKLPLHHKPLEVQHSRCCLDAQMLLRVFPSVW